MEDNKDYHIGKYQYEELDNGAVVRDLEENWAKAALYSKYGLPSAETINKDDIIRMIGEFVYGDLQAFQNLIITNKVNMTIKFEKAE